MKNRKCTNILNEETLKELEATTWPQVKARVRSQHLRSEYLGCDDNGRLYFKTTSGTTPGKWWRQQIEFKDMDKAIEILNQRLFMRRRKVLQMLFDGDVSVWCLTPDTLIQMSDGTQKRIVDVKEGDYVVTHTGSYKRVRKVYKRRVHESLYSIKTEGHVRPLILTGNHEVLAFKVEKRKQFRYKNNPDTPTWEMPISLTTDDYLCLPVMGFESRNDVGEKIAFLLGAYIGDGNILRVRKIISGVQYTYDTDEFDLERTYIDLLSGISDKVPHVYNSKNKKTGYTWRTIHYYNKEFANYVITSCGAGIDEKHLPVGFENWSERSRLALLAGLWVTDGDVYESGVMKFDTSKFRIHNQVKILLQTLGIRYHEIQTGRPGYNRKYGVEEKGKLFRLQLSYIDGKKLYDYLLEHRLNEKTIKGKHHELENVRGGFTFYKVQGVETIDYDGYVYNLEVDEDNSYIANDVIVHNCNDYSWHYYFKYVAWKNGYGLQKETRAPTRNNVQEDHSLCKHLVSCMVTIPEVSEQILKDYKKKKILPGMAERLKNKMRSE